MGPHVTAYAQSSRCMRPSARTKLLRTADPIQVTTFRRKAYELFLSDVLLVLAPRFKLPP